MLCLNDSFNKNDITRPMGQVHATIEYADGRKPKKFVSQNTVLRTGREALARCLVGDINGNFNFFISRMLFGDGGTAGGTPKYVNTDRNGLFGLTRASKPVIAAIDPNFPSQLSVTSVVAYSEANGYNLNEMALQLNTGDLYSMTTFPDMGKTPLLQLTFVWRISFV